MVIIRCDIMKSRVLKVPPYKPLPVRTLAIKQWGSCLWFLMQPLCNWRLEVYVRSVNPSRCANLTSSVSSWAWLYTTASHWTSASPPASTRSCWPRPLCHVTSKPPSAWQPSPWTTSSRLCLYVHKLWHTTCYHIQSCQILTNTHLSITDGWTSCSHCVVWCYYSNIK